MLHVALCGQISFEGDSLAAALADLSRSRGGEEPQVDHFVNASDLLEACLSGAEDAVPFDLAISASVLPDTTGVHLARELDEAGLFEDCLHLVLCSPNPQHALALTTERIDAFIREPVTTASLERAVTPLLEQIEQEQSAATILRCREGRRRVTFSRLTYAETSGRNQLVHRLGEHAPLTIRCSSRMLFACLENDARFYKVGSSFIVNLDYISSFSLRSSTVTLLDGTQIAVPVRIRTAFADIICEHASLAL